MAASFNNILSSSQEDFIAFSRTFTATPSSQPISQASGNRKPAVFLPSCFTNGRFFGSDKNFLIGLIILFALSLIVLSIIFIFSASSWRSDLQSCSEVKRHLASELIDLQEPMDTPDRCGGLIDIDGTRDLVYHSKALDNSSQPNIIKPTICMWLIRSKNGAGIKLSLLNSTEAQFDSQKSRLEVSHGHTVKLAWVQFLENFETEQNFDSPFIIIWFYASPQDESTGLGFHLKLSESDNGGVFKNSNLTIDLKEYNEMSSRRVSYPPENGGGGSLEYPDNARIFFWVKPVQGKVIKFDLIYLDVELDHDGVQLLYFELAMKRQVEVTASKLTSNYGKMSDKIFYNNKNEPFLLYFHSDASGSGKGLKFTFNYV